jgi:FkbM family methyltransferase
MKPFDIEDREGWMWPRRDSACWEWLQQEKDLPELISHHCNDKGIVVQAGGYCGLYVKAYADLFNTVYTFEPNPQNFFCLTNNAQQSNIIKFQCCLGDENRSVGITYKKANSGVSRVFGDGVFPTIKIDDLKLPGCDLIHLDIEGYEYFALRGAIETIKQYKPIIVLEWLDHNNQFDVTSDDILNWLTDLGYTEIAQIYHDKVFAAK